jgi:MFS family permease
MGESHATNAATGVAAGPQRNHGWWSVAGGARGRRVGARKLPLASGATALYSVGRMPGELRMSNDRAARVNPVRANSGRSPETVALKHALTGLAGASIEWYDFLLFATAAALVFPTVFFSATLSPFVALIASFSTFAVGFVARPVGAVLFGIMGDRVGRKAAFATALILMGTATMLIGFLPSYRTAGALAPLALTLLRLAQGLAVGGQWGGAILLATESVSKSRRGLYGSIAQAGLPVGVILANLAVLIANGATSPVDFMTYGWRIPFLLSIVLVGLGLFIHFRVEDTVAFRQLQQAKPLSGANAAADATKPMRANASPILLAFRLHPKSILLAAGANVGGMLAFYILITYVIAYGTSAAGLQLPRTTMLVALLVAQVAFLPCIIFAGTLSDRVGRRRMYITGVVLLGIWGFILFPMIETRSLLWITAAISIGLFFVSLSYGPLAAMFAELFDTRVRYCAVSLAYQISAIVGGALAPIIATSLYARYHSNLSISIYMGGASALSLVCISLLKTTHETDGCPRNCMRIGQVARHTHPGIEIGR